MQLFSYVNLLSSLFFSVYDWHVLLPRYIIALYKNYYICNELILIIVLILTLKIYYNKLCIFC